MTPLLITESLRTQLNLMCQRLSYAETPPVIAREHLHQYVRRYSPSRYTDDQLEQLVEGFVSFWNLA